MKDRLSDEQAKIMLEQLSVYYREPVMPLSKFCEGIQQWGECMEQSHDEDMSKLGEKVVQVVNLTARKSNLLYRIFFLEENPRSEPCPIHKGEWSGCVHPDNACGHCMSGSNVTGWVRETE